MARLNLSFLGSPHIERGGAHLLADTRKGVALLAYLTLQSEVESRDYLATLLWANYDQQHARAALRRTLFQVKSALGEGVLAVTRETIRLLPNADLWCDVIDFHNHLIEQRAHGHAEGELCAACRSALVMAAALYRDDFFAGFHLADSSPFDEWRFFQAESLRRDMIGVLDCLVQNYSAHGDYGAAIAYARRWLALDPLHEPVHRWLMRLYSWLGRQSAALRQYDECVHILHTELHDQPERETTDLYITIKARQLTAPTAKVPVSSVTASSPVLVPPLPDTIASITAVQWEYPAFVGCLSELKHLHQALQQALRGQGQVVFVTGEAGRGKTALLREFASQAYAAAAELLTVVGFCNAQTGSGDSYLPFRQILRLLTGDIQSVWTRRILSPAHINRLLHSAPATVQCLIEHGPGLIDTMIARSGLMKHFSVNGNRTFSLGEPLSGAALGRNDLAEQYVAVMQALAHHQPLLI
ncbi:MAG: AAA family ATPase, partial [Caldilineaceae bacterium]|nr:AAA family ATPase [Caldilineaceae bacterium]